MGRYPNGMTEALQALNHAAHLERLWEERAAQLPDDARRVLFREWWERASDAEQRGNWVPRYPSYLRGLTCGAIKRDGKACASTTLCANGRCKFHGGASTGPRSPEGRARALENLKLGRQKHGKS